ncbi:unnamed protein product [Meganyctiphanes norvegica]|uniref:Uncharacterized protein n=1 Tax=Meganyctiphanes norvegica TaxID=48144 RepID=A0AAV2S1E3_MEGNR
MYKCSAVFTGNSKVSERKIITKKSRHVSKSTLSHTCKRTFHGSCLSLSQNTISAYINNQDEIPFVCKECWSIVPTYIGTMVRLVCQQFLLINDNLSKVDQRVLNLEKSVTLNDKFEGAVVQIDKQIQDLSNIISEFQAASNKKFEKSPIEIKADIRDCQDRKKELSFLECLTLIMILTH